MFRRVDHEQNNRSFDQMSIQEILAQKPGKWGDIEVLDVPKEVLASAVEGLGALQRGQWSPDDLYFTTRSGKRVSHPTNTLKNLKPFHAQPQLVKSRLKKKTKRGRRKHN